MKCRFLCWNLSVRLIKLFSLILYYRITCGNNFFNLQLISGSHERKSMRTAMWRKEHKAFVTLGVVMGGFLLCWLPFFSWYLTVTICGDLCPCPHIIVAILFWIGKVQPLYFLLTKSHQSRDCNEFLFMSKLNSLTSSTIRTVVNSCASYTTLSI